MKGKQDARNKYEKIILGRLCHPGSRESVYLGNSPIRSLSPTALYNAQEFVIVLIIFTRRFHLAGPYLRRDFDRKSSEFVLLRFQRIVSIEISELDNIATA